MAFNMERVKALGTFSRRVLQDAINLRANLLPHLKDSKVYKHILKKEKDQCSGGSVEA